LDFYNFKPFVGTGNTSQYSVISSSTIEKHSDICHQELLHESEYHPWPKALMHTAVNQTLRYV